MFEEGAAMRVDPGARIAVGYGALLAAGTAALQWLDDQRVVHERWDDL